MSYRWCNAAKLDTLQVSSAESTLVFKAGDETAEVYLDEVDIKKVVFRQGNCETVISNSDAHHLVVGQGNTQRDVFHYLKPDGPATELRLGITKHRGIGTWSSLPHAFELNLECGFEEVFFYLITGGNRRAIQVGEGMWHDGSAVKSTWFVDDHSFSTVPMGYHPIVGEPGVTVHYVWAYLAKKASWEKI